MKISIVLPAYNESAIAAESVREVDSWLALHGESYEIIVSDDGSNDGTAAIVEQLGLDAVRVVRQPHMGKGSALTAGLLEARADYIGFIDIDLEIPVHHVADCLSALEAGADAAIGSKVLDKQEARRRPLRRRIATFGFNLLARILFRTGIGDHQAGLKMFRQASLAPLLPGVGSTGWLWDTEVIARLSSVGATIEEVPITTRHVRPGHVNVVVTSLEMLKDLFILRRRLGR